MASGLESFCRSRSDGWTAILHQNGFTKSGFPKCMPRLRQSADIDIYFQRSYDPLPKVSTWLHGREEAFYTWSYSSSNASQEAEAISGRNWNQTQDWEEVRRWVTH